MSHRVSAVVIGTTSVLLFTMVGGTLWWLLSPGAEGEAFTTVALLILVGLAAFIGLMNFLSFSAQYIGVADAKQPFGLPEGTVRAILTIAFIVLVGVLASFLLANNKPRQDFTADNKIPVATGLTLQEAQALQQRMSASGLAVYRPTPTPAGAAPVAGTPSTYDVDVFPRLDHRLSEDVSKQILTMLSTILAAMIGFYFGARSEGGVSAADEAAERLRVVADLNSLNEQHPSIETVRASASVKLRLDPTKSAQITQIVKELDEIQQKVDKAKAAVGDQTAPIDKVRTTRDEAKGGIARLKDIDERIKHL